MFACLLNAAESTEADQWETDDPRKAGTEGKRGWERGSGGGGGLSVCNDEGKKKKSIQWLFRIMTLPIIDRLPILRDQNLDFLTKTTRGESIAASRGQNRRTLVGALFCWNQINLALLGLLLRFACLPEISSETTSVSPAGHVVVFFFLALTRPTRRAMCCDLPCFAQLPHTPRVHCLLFISAYP